jgi:hypothetical protein
MHDPRIGRFLSIDPLTRSYPFYSPYAFSGNRVIDSRELEGLEPLSMIDKHGKLTKPMIAVLNVAYGFKVNRLEHTTWGLFKKPKGAYMFAQTKFNNIRYNRSISSSTSNIPSKMNHSSYESFWFSLASHEHKHRDEQTRNPVIGVFWMIRYFTADIAVGGVKALFKKGNFAYNTYKNMPSEKRAYRIGDDPPANSESQQLFNFRNGALMNILNSNASDKVKTLQATFLAFDFKQEQLTNSFKSGDMNRRQYSRKSNKLSKRRSKTIKRL